jgi:hypothetical protein
MKKIMSGLVMSACAVAVLVSPASAQYITGPSSGFANQYDGNQIWDGTNFVNQWAQAGGATPASLSLNGTNLVQTNDANNGWVQHDGGTTPWETGTGSFALEVSLKLNDTDLSLNDNIALWMEGQGNRQIIVVTSTAVHAWGGNSLGPVLIDNVNNTDDFHTFRVNFNPNDTSAGPEGTYQVLRDGTLISGAGLARESGQSNSRLIVGDCCTQPLGNPVDQFEIQYVRYTYVPEPGAIALCFAAMGGVLSRRRRR